MLGGVVGVIALSASAQAQAPKDFSAGCSSSGCHHDLTARKLVHDPADDDGCDACHEIKDAKKHTFTFVVEEKTLCLECHDAFEGKVTHGPAAEGQCTACHDPHASAREHLLAKKPADICLKCHDQAAAPACNWSRSTA